MMDESHRPEESLLRFAARLDLRPDQIREHIHGQWYTLDWRWLIWASMQARIPSLLTRYLVPLEDHTGSYLSASIFDDLWKVPAIRHLYLRAYQEAPITYSPLARFHYALAARRQTVTQALVMAASALKQQSTPALIVKGSALSVLYPPNTRDSSDVDIVLQASSDVWPAVQALRSLGFKEGILSVSQRTPSNIGIKTTSTAAFGAEVDVHGGGFDLVSLGFLEAPLWQRSAVSQIDENTAGRLPSLEDSLLLNSAHQCREATMTLRDINDAYILISREPEQFDWDYVMSTAQQNELTSVLHALLAEATYLYPDLHIPNRLLDRTFTTAVAQHAMHRTRPGRLSWSIPLHVEHIGKFDSKRYGVRVAFRHVVIQSLTVLERDLAWHSEESNGRSRMTRWFVRTLRFLLRTMLIRDGWRLSSPPVGGHIWFVPIVPRIDQQDVKISAVSATDETLPEVTGIRLKRYDDMLLCSSLRRNEPDLLVTPSGLYYSTKYAETRFSISLFDLEKRAEQILRALASKGIVTVQVTERPAQQSQ